MSEFFSSPPGSDHSEGNCQASDRPPVPRGHDLQLRLPPGQRGEEDCGELRQVEKSEQQDWRHRRSDRK